jgi:hypothetical protein
VKAANGTQAMNRSIRVLQGVFITGAYKRIGGVLHCKQLI